jgi:AraC-like DNA-binding protein
MKEYPHEYADIWYTLPTSMQKQGGCWIVRAGENIAKPHYYVGPKIIAQFGFHMVQDGKLKVAEGGRTVELGKGDAFCLFPGKSYVYQTLSGSELPLRMAWLALDGQQVPLLLSELGLTPEQFYITQVIDRQVWGMVRQIVQLFKKETMDSLREQHLLFGMLWCIKQNLRTKQREWNRNWVTQVKEYLELHFTEHIRIDTVAQYAGVHRSHLYASFLKAFGCSPIQYLQRLRMEKGAQLLKESRLSVTAISLTLGYPDLYSFTRAFTKFFGISPTTYRG